MSNAGISRPKSASEHTLSSRTPRRVRSHAADVNLCSIEDLHQCLYQRNQVISVSTDDFRSSGLHKEEAIRYCKSPFCQMFAKVIFNEYFRNHGFAGLRRYC